MKSKRGIERPFRQQLQLKQTRGKKKSGMYKDKTTIAKGSLRGRVGDKTGCVSWYRMVRDFKSDVQFFS